MASLVNHIFVHLKRPNNCTAHAVCISGMFTLNLLFFRDQDQRRDLSLVLLKGEKLLHRMHVETRTHTKHNARYIHHIARWTLLITVLLKKNKLLHLVFANTNTRIHTHVYTRSCEMFLRRLKTLPRASKRLL